MISTELYAMDPDGSNVQKLSNFSGSVSFVSCPKISADGKYLTLLSNYESWKSAYQMDVFRLDLLTGELHRVTGNVWEGPLPQEKATLKVQYKISTFPATSHGMVSYMGCNDMVQVNYGSEHTFENVPAGKRIWVKAIGENGVGMIQYLTLTPNSINTIIMDMNLGTTGYTSAYPSFEGSKIAATLTTNSFGTDLNASGDNQVINNVKILDIDGGLIDDVTSPALSGNGAYSNDGTKLAFRTGIESYSSLEYLNTSNYHSTPTIIEKGYASSFEGYVAFDFPSWSPDGEKIVFQKTVATNTSINSNICLYNFSTNQTTKITNYSGKEVALNPCFSPDNKQVLFNLWTSSNNQFDWNVLGSGDYTTSIYKIDLITGTIIPLITDGLSGDPSWGIVNGTTPKDTITTTILQENFDGDIFPPENWIVSSFNDNYTWRKDYMENPDFREIDPNDEYSAFCEWDSLDSDEWLVTPQFSLGKGQASLEFYALYNSEWLIEATLKLQISTNGGDTWTELWSAIDDGTGLKWRKTTIDLSPYSGNPDLKLAWEYIGNLGDVVAVDGIKLTGVSNSETAVLTVSSNTLGISALTNSTKTFNITSTIDWTVTSNQAWLTFNPATGSNNATITLTAQANPTTENRTAIVTISGTGVAAQTITVIQDAGITSINDLDNPIIFIFPNPANTSLFINGLPQNSTITIFEMNGKQIIGKQLSNNQLDISDLKCGFYTLIISNNNKTVKRKFIKQ